MSRNMIETNRAIFESLQSHCTSKGLSTPNSDKARWITTEKTEEKEFIKHSNLKEFISFGRARKIALIKFREHSFICTIGFNGEYRNLNIIELDIHAGQLTSIIYLLTPQPKATAAEITNLIGLRHKGSQDFHGYDHEEIHELFERIRIYSAPVEQQPFKCFFRISLSECLSSNSWISERLAETLHLVCDLELDNIPYKTLCRSIFDNDPSALFLALYRCLEALYAYKSSKSLIDDLNLSKSWQEVASTLEDTLGWYPKEESSLSSLLEYSVSHDLLGIFSATGLEPPTTAASLATSAAKRIYKLRNSLVHFRPYHQQNYNEKIDWNSLCENMASIVLHIYEAVYRA